jgi:hypothetical protein
MRPVLAILEVIWSVNSFTPIWVLTQGGPSGQTTTLGVYAYITAFSGNNYGAGAAIAVVTVVLARDLRSRIREETSRFPRPVASSVLRKPIAAQP